MIVEYACEDCTIHNNCADRIIINPNQIPRKSRALARVCENFEEVGYEIIKETA